MDTLAHRAFERYQEALRDLPPSGGGGCHVALLGAANLGRLAGVSREQIAADLAAHIHGTRHVTAGEIEDAVNKSFDTAGEIPLRPRVQVDGPRLLEAILARGEGATLEALEAISPDPLTWDRARDHLEILARLWGPDEELFIGERHDAGAQHVQTRSEWKRRFKNGYEPPPHIIPNPLTGKPGLTKEGKPSYRADSCVASFRFVTVEFDEMPLEQQCQFWAGVKLPVAALIYSGNKSIHGWVRVDAANVEEWTTEVEGKLFDVLTALGVDSSCKNEARLSRLPGHFRAEKQQWQRILYLDPAGRPVLP